MDKLVGGLAIVIAGTVFAHAGEPAGTMEASAGKIYTDANGMALYTFDSDMAGRSNCHDQCATNWPPLAADPGTRAEGG